MRLPRTSIAGLMGIVLVAALAFTALRSGSAFWAGTTFLATCGVLALAVVGAICLDGKVRAWCLGFAALGGGYLVLSLGYTESPRQWNSPLELLLDRFDPRAAVMGGGTVRDFSWGIHTRDQVAHSLVGLAAGILGGWLSLVLFGTAGQAGLVRVEARLEGPPVGKGGMGPAIVGLVALAVAPVLALIGLRRAAGLTAALAYYGTWAFLLLAVVGAIFGPRTRRAAWLGAFLFGIGYMQIAFRTPPLPNWPQALPNDLLGIARDRLPWAVLEAPPSSEGTAATNARIIKALERPIPMHFPQETPLEDVLKYIRSETRVAGQPDLPIYVDPLGLQECEKTMLSPVTIDLDGPPLRTTLSLVLKQLGLTYAVGSGLLAISSVSSDDPPLPYSTGFASAHEDPFLVVGHCLFACLAAGLGSRLATVVGRGRGAALS